MERPDVDYVSVKVSSVAAQLNLWSYRGDAGPDEGRAPRRLARAPRPRRRRPPSSTSTWRSTATSRLTLDAFTQLLDEPEFLALEAGVVLQAYIPDSLAALVRLAVWAASATRRGGAPVKVRIVKGANLAAERVDAAMTGGRSPRSPPRPGPTPITRRCSNTPCGPSTAARSRVGVAGHNVFDLAWAHLLAEARGVSVVGHLRVAPGHGPGDGARRPGGHGPRPALHPGGGPSDFDHALAYLFRRLEENAGGENFIAALPEIDTTSEPSPVRRARFAGPRSARAPSRCGRRRSPPPGRRRRVGRCDGFRQRTRHRSDRPRRPPRLTGGPRRRPGRACPARSTRPASTGWCAPPPRARRVGTGRRPASERPVLERCGRGVGRAATDAGRPDGAPKRARPLPKPTPRSPRRSTSPASTPCRPAGWPGSTEPRRTRSAPWP